MNHEDITSVLGGLYKSKGLRDEGEAVRKFLGAIDELLCGGKYSLCDDLMKQIDVRAAGTRTAIGLLTLTVPAKPHFQNRTGLYEKTMQCLREQYTAEEVIEILSGLE